MKKLLGVLLVLSFVLVGCGDENYEQTPTVDITMPYETDYYETEEWTVEGLIEEFESMGFTNVVTERMGASSDYVYGVIHTVRIDGSMTGWDEGEVYSSDDEVEIRYYDPTPTLTVDNCPELAEILNGETTSWEKFASEHDGEFIEFESCVVERIDDNRLSDPIIYVCGGDYSNDIDKQKIHLTYVSVDDEVEDHVFYGLQGNNYKIIGQIDLSNSKYYNMLTIEVVLIEDRE